MTVQEVSEKCSQAPKLLFNPPEAILNRKYIGTIPTLFESGGIVPLAILSLFPENFYSAAYIALLLFWNAPIR